MKIVTGILAENMRRFNTKNLTERKQQNSEEPINEAYVEYGGVRITRVILSYETNKIYYKIKALERPHGKIKRGNPGLRITRVSYSC
jgi:hypothetical protein